MGVFEEKIKALRLMNHNEVVSDTYHTQQRAREMQCSYYTRRDTLQEVPTVTGITSPTMARQHSTNVGEGAVTHQVIPLQQPHEW